MYSAQSPMQQQARNTITLKGSTEIVMEFFAYSINSILFQRGVYRPESFTKATKYGLQMMVTSDQWLQKYLQLVLSQLSEWLLGGATVQKLVLVISSVQTEAAIERWTFDIDTDQQAASYGFARHEKSEKEIQNEIQAIIRQITASSTFLPLLHGDCTFDLLVYLFGNADVPRAWEESAPMYISNQQEVRLRSFSTTIHRVDAAVAFQDSPAPDDRPAAPRAVDNQTKIDRLIALCDNDQPLSSSDIAAIQQLLAAGSNVACGLGASK